MSANSHHLKQAKNVVSKHHYYLIHVFNVNIYDISLRSLGLTNGKQWTPTKLQTKLWGPVKHLRRKPIGPGSLWHKAVAWSPWLVKISSDLCCSTGDCKTSLVNNWNCFRNSRHFIESMRTSYINLFLTSVFWYPHLFIYMVVHPSYKREPVISPIYLDTNEIDKLRYPHK